MKNRRIPWSKMLIGILFLLILVVYYLHPFPNILSWDIFAYYLYLPAAFIHHDLGFRDISWIESILQKYHGSENLYQLKALPEGGWIITVSMGMALLNLPFFLLAWIFTPLTQFPADGFSYPYQLAITIAGQFYTLAGLVFLRKVLLKFVDERLTCMTIVLIVLGTNFFNNALYSSAMPHNYLFALITVFLWAMIRWEESRKIMHIVIIGLSGGFITLVRPNEVVVFLLPLLWGVRNVNTLIARMKLIGRYWQQMLIMLAVILFVGLPQMIFWKHVTGSWLHYSYPDYDRFLFSSPFIMEVLFSFRKGWFIYTPLMLFALVGFIFVYRRRKELFLPLLIYFIVNLWIISSWTCWWYAGADFSNRALISCYAVLAIPLALLLESIMSSKLRYLFLPVFIFIAGLNLFQTWQFNHGIIDGYRMTKEYYFRVFGKTGVDGADRKFLSLDRFNIKYDDIPEDVNGDHRIAGLWDFEMTAAKKSDYYISDTAVSGRQAFALDSSMQFSPGYDEPYNAITSKEYAWIKAGVCIYIPRGYHEVMPLLVANFSHDNYIYAYRTVGINRDSVMFGGWNRVSMNYLTPEPWSKHDRLHIYVWQQGRQRILIDDLKVEIFEP